MAIPNTSMKSIENKILAIVKNNFGADYKQVRNSFYKFYGEFFHLVEVQFLTTGQQEKSMTIYFGVLVPRIFELLWKEKYKADDYKKLTARNGVFNCNINDILEDFKGKPKIKYWNSKDDETLFIEIDAVVKNKLVPFVEKFDSLNRLDEIIDRVQYPWKNSTDIPVMILALKFLLNRNDQFFNLAEHLKLSNNHFAHWVDDLVNRKTFEKKI